MMKNQQFSDDYVLLQELTNSYLDNNSTDYTKRVGDAYINEFYKRLMSTDPTHVEGWLSFLKTSSGEKFSRWSTGAGEFLALLDVRKKLWTNVYQDDMAQWVTQNPTVVPPKPLKNRLIFGWSLVNRMLLGLTGLTLILFVCFVIAKLVFVSFVTGCVLAGLFVITGGSILIWKIRYHTTVSDYKTMVNNRKLVWNARFGVTPKVDPNTGELLLPSPPYSWAEDKDDVVKYREITNFLVSKYVNPYGEQSFPVLVLPNTNPKLVPVEVLEVLKKSYSVTDEVGVVE